jgi:hypothetical protein
MINYDMTRSSIYVWPNRVGRNTKGDNDERKVVLGVTFSIKIAEFYIANSAFAFSQMEAICSLIFSASSLLPRPSWYGIWASNF